MNYPPRLSHLATVPIIASRLVPTYAESHQLEDEEARQRLEAVLKGRLREELLAATWAALLGGVKRLDESGLLEKVAKSLQAHERRAGKVAQVTPGWSAWMIAVDLEVGTASDAARKVLETEEGRKRLAAGVQEVGAFLANELTRK